MTEVYLLAGLNCSTRVNYSYFTLVARRICAAVLFFFFNSLPTVVPATKLNLDKNSCVCKEHPAPSNRCVVYVL